MKSLLTTWVTPIRATITRKIRLHFNTAEVDFLVINWLLISHSGPASVFNLGLPLTLVEDAHVVARIRLSIFDHEIAEKSVEQVDAFGTNSRK